MRPAPDPCSLEAQSVYSFHKSALVPKFLGALASGAFCSSPLFPSARVSFGPLAFICVELFSAIVSAKKSMSTFPFITLLGGVFDATSFKLYSPLSQSSRCFSIV
ncbi:hypothetical protein Tco_0335302 [Tanacetum coccineum]